MTGKQYYANAPFGLLVLNWIVQRVFRINAEMKQSVHFTTKIHGSKNLILKGESAKLSLIVSEGCFFSCLHETITIGENTIFAPRVSFISDNHELVNRSKFNSRKISIGNNCWLGTGATILPGVTIGDNVTVGANSVVTKSFESNSVIVGNPAKLIKHIKI